MHGSQQWGGSVERITILGDRRSSRVARRKSAAMGCGVACENMWLAGADECCRYEPYGRSNLNAEQLRR